MQKNIHCDCNTDFSLQSSCFVASLFPVSNSHSSCLTSGSWTGSRQRTKAVQLRGLVSLPLEVRFSCPALNQLLQVNTLHIYLDHCKQKKRRNNISFSQLSLHVYVCLLMSTGACDEGDTMQTITNLKHEVTTSFLTFHALLPRIER